MKPITTLSQFANLTKKIRAGGKKIVSNCYLLPPEILKYAEHNRMFYEEDPDGLYIFCEEQDFYHLYFHCYAGESIQPPHIQPRNKPVLIDLVAQTSTPTEIIVGMKKPWEKAGFTEYRVFHRMELDTSLTQQKTNPKTFSTNGFYFASAEISQSAGILSLWRKSLDILSTPIPYEDELVQFLTNREICCMMNMENNIIAAMQLQQNGNVGTIKHVAVDEAYRGRGLATILLLNCLNRHSELRKFMLWVDEQNTPAIKLYLANDFGFDGRISYQLLLDNIHH